MPATNIIIGNRRTKAWLSYLNTGRTRLGRKTLNTYKEDINKLYFIKDMKTRVQIKRLSRKEEFE